MSVNLTFHLLTKDQMAKHYESEVLLAGGKGDFCDVVHENYQGLWISPRDWFFEDFLEPKLRWGEAAIFTKQALLDMLPKARDYLNDPEEEFDKETVAAIRADYLELEIELLKLDESVHTIIGYKC